MRNSITYRKRKTKSGLNVAKIQEELTAAGPHPVAWVIDCGFACQLANPLFVKKHLIFLGDL